MKTHVGFWASPSTRVAVNVPCPHAYLWLRRARRPQHPCTDHRTVALRST